MGGPEAKVAGARVPATSDRRTLLKRLGQAWLVLTGAMLPASQAAARPASAAPEPSSDVGVSVDKERLRAWETWADIPAGSRIGKGFRRFVARECRTPAGSRVPDAWLRRIAAWPEDDLRLVRETVTALLRDGEPVQPRLVLRWKPGIDVRLTLTLDGTADPSGVRQLTIALEGAFRPADGREG